MSRGGGEEGFLSRWSRRKREAAEVPARAAGEDAEAPLAPGAGAEAAAGAAPPPDAAAGEEAALPSSGTDPAAEPFDPASLPPVQSLTAESDLSVFFRPRVPAALRNAALRRVWSVDPAIRDYIGPADYAWDFNAPDGVPGFALELGGDAKRLLAQAIGLDHGAATEGDREPPAAGDGEDPGAPAGTELASLPPEEEQAAAGAAGDGPGQVATPVPHLPATGGAGDPAPPAMRPEGPEPLPESLPLRPSGRILGAAEPAPAVAADPDPPAPPRRRHGGARPA